MKSHEFYEIYNAPYTGATARLAPTVNMIGGFGHAGAAIGPLTLVTLMPDNHDSDC